VTHLPCYNRCESIAPGRSSEGGQQPLPGSSSSSASSTPSWMTSLPPRLPCNSSSSSSCLPCWCAAWPSWGLVSQPRSRSACWPAACAGNDLQGLAEPGSGKTLAYLLPVLARLDDAACTARRQAAGGQVSSESTVPPVLPEVLIEHPRGSWHSRFMGSVLPCSV